MRELVWMAEGCGQEHWQHTSTILAMLANANRDPKKTRAFKPSDFDPYAKRDKQAGAIKVAKMSELKGAFTRKGK